MQENKTYKNTESQIPHQPKKKKNSTLLLLTHLLSSVQLHPPASKQIFKLKKKMKIWKNIRRWKNKLPYKRNWEGAGMRPNFPFVVGVVAERDWERQRVLMSLLCPNSGRLFWALDDHLTHRPNLYDFLGSSKSRLGSLSLLDFWIVGSYNPTSWTTILITF